MEYANLEDLQDTHERERKRKAGIITFIATVIAIFLLFFPFFYKKENYQGKANARYQVINNIGYCSFAFKKSVSFIQAIIKIGHHPKQ